MQALYRRIAGLDVHRMKHVATVLIEQADGSVAKETREYGAFKRDLSELVAWFAAERIECAVMESTGVYWKSVYAALEAAGIPALVVNARHARNVPGRKTDVADSEWLASLGRFGLLRGSFIAEGSAGAAARVAVPDEAHGDVGGGEEPAAQGAG